MNRFSEGAPKVDGSIFHVEDHAAQCRPADFAPGARSPASAKSPASGRALTSLGGSPGSEARAGLRPKKWHQEATNT